MANVDLNSAIGSLVASKVEEALAPYRDILKRMSQFVGVGAGVGEGRAGQPAPVKRGPGRPPASSKAPATKTARRFISKDEVEMVSNFEVGQKVSYKQGRGDFEASVVGIDAEQGTVTIRREVDGKEIDRPASKVYKA